MVNDVAAPDLSAADLSAVPDCVRDVHADADAMPMAMLRAIGERVPAAGAAA